MPFSQYSDYDINQLRRKIELLEEENKQLKKGYQNKLSNYIKTSYQLCPSCSKKIMMN
jgi:hypothetical protein